MRTAALLVSFNVSAPHETADFFESALGFVRVAREAEYAIVSDEGTGQRLVFLEVTGAELLPQPASPVPMQGAIVYLTLGAPAEVDAEHERLAERAVPIATPLQTVGGSRMFQVVAPGGVAVEISAFVDDGSEDDS